MDQPKLTAAAGAEGLRNGRAASRLRSWFELEGLEIAVIAFWVAALTALVQGMVVQDTWLSFVDGRLIVHRWLPHVDTLTRWTLGRHWIDQQWGAHVVLYELVSHGGLRAAVAAGIACVAVALVAVAVSARKLGGTAPRTAAILFLPVLASGWLMQLRSQSFALPLFACLYGLLALDSQRPGRRVLWVLPLLVVWANVHGSVALGAALVLIRGLGLVLRGPSRMRGMALAVGAPLTLFATPYGYSMAGYYRLMLFHPPLASFVTEWKPATVSVLTAPFFASAFVLAALWGAQRGLLTVFERWVLPLLLVAALVALRNAIWFELAAAVSFPRLLDAARPRSVDTSGRARRRNFVLAAAAVGAAGLFSFVQLRRAPSLIETRTPPAAAAIVARAAGTKGLVIADDAHADWLLWQEPSLAGQIAYDVRFELFTKGQLEQLKLLLAGSHAAWGSCGSTARVITFNGRADEAAAIREHVLASRSRTIVDGPDFVAVLQPSAVQSRACGI